MKQQRDTGDLKHDTYTMGSGIRRTAPTTLHLQLKTWCWGLELSTDQGIDWLFVNAEK